MSIDIIDQKAFIKTDTGIIMLVLGGSNNCTMRNYATGREIRERRWFEPFGGKYHNLSETELLRRISEDFPADGAEHELFKYGGKMITTGTFYNWVKSGCRSACSVERYIAYNPLLRLCCKVEYTEELENGTIRYNTVLGDRISCSEVLSEWLHNANNWITYDKPAKSRAYILIEWDTINKIVMPMQNAADECIVKKNAGNMYLMELSEKSSSWTRDKTKAIIFNDESMAFAFLSGNNLNGYSHPVRVPDPVEKQWVIYIESGKHAGSYIQKKTARRYYTTRLIEHAVAYPTEKTAIRSMEKIINNDLQGHMVIRNNTLSYKEV